MISLTHAPADLPARLDRLALTLALFALLLAPIGLLADKAVVILALAAAVAGGLAAGPAGLPWRILDRRLALALATLLAWCFISSAWSPHPTEALGLALRVALLVFVLLYMVALAGLLAEPQRNRVALAFCGGFLLTVALLSIELVFGGPIMTLLQGPARNDYATFSRLNRGVSVLTILVWPLAALAWSRGHRWAALLAPPALLVPVLFSQSSASILALGAALPAAALAGLSRSLARLVMAVAVIVPLFGSPFIASLAEHSGLTAEESLQATARIRLHVWNVVSTRISERPLLGWGFDASPHLPTDGFQPFRTGEKVIPSHPHNGALQIMVETGLVGSLLTFALLVLVARRIDRLPAVQRACAVAMLVAILGVAATAYGITQSHWLAVIGAAAAVFVAVQPVQEAVNSKSGSGLHGNAKDDPSTL